MTLQRYDFSFPEPFYTNIAHLFYNFYFEIRKKNLICVKTKKMARQLPFLSLPLYKLLILPKDYYSTLKKQGIHLHRCEVLVSYNTLVAINEKDLLVYKCSFNEIGYQNVKKNYSFLKTSGFSKCPKAVSISEIDDVVVSAESLSDGTFLKVKDLNSDIINKLFHDLEEMYLKNISRQTFNLEREFGQYDYLFAYYPPSWKDVVLQIQAKIRRLLHSNRSDSQICKTIIHGDLTYRNILKLNDSTMYVDFDRSEISYPEFDFYLFSVDLETHKVGQPTYESLFNNIFGLIDGKLALIDEVDYYEIFPDFGENKVFTQEVKLLFLYRTLVLTLQYYTSVTNVPERILTQVNNGLDKYI